MSCSTTPTLILDHCALTRRLSTDCECVCIYVLLYSDVLLFFLAVQFAVDVSSGCVNFSVFSKSVSLQMVLDTVCITGINKLAYTLYVYSL